MARISYDEPTAAAFKAVREVPRDGLLEWQEAVRRHLRPSQGMTLVDIDELIAEAVAVVNPRTVDDRLFGDVGCALVTDQGNVYRGVCIDTGSGTGFCAEASAIAAMVTAGESRIRRIVAVWKDESGRPYVLSPCGRCREFIRQMHAENLDTEVVLGKDRVVALQDLLPNPCLFTPVDSDL